jgi:hypothetical protein
LAFFFGVRLVGAAALLQLSNDPDRANYIVDRHDMHLPVRNCSQTAVNAHPNCLLFFRRAGGLL